MGVKLNKRAYAHARQLIESGQIVVDDRDNWSEHRPSAATENAFIREHGLTEYGRWYLGIDEDKEDSKGRYRFPYGDLVSIHRCGVVSAESRAGQYKYFDIEVAAAHLHGMLDKAASTTGR